MEEKQVIQSLNKAIIDIRVELQKRNTKKSGLNKFAGFSYYELSDFLPTLNELMQERGVNDLFTIENDEVVLLIMLGEETNRYAIPYTRFDTPLNKQGKPSMQDIQYLGALNTYYKRYLYLNAFGITDGEVIDSMDKIETPIQNSTPKVVDTYLEEIRKEFKQACMNRNLDLAETFKTFKINEKSTKEEILIALSQLDTATKKEKF